jgi:hypothetical protein
MAVLNLRTRPELPDQREDWPHNEALNPPAGFAAQVSASAFYESDCQKRSCPWRMPRAVHP